MARRPGRFCDWSAPGEPTPGAAIERAPAGTESTAAHASSDAIRLSRSWQGRPKGNYSHQGRVCQTPRPAAAGPSQGAGQQPARVAGKLTALRSLTCLPDVGRWCAVCRRGMLLRRHRPVLLLHRRPRRVLRPGKHDPGWVRRQASARPGAPHAARVVAPARCHGVLREDTPTPCGSGPAPSPDWTQTPGRAACCVTTRPLQAADPAPSPDWTQTPGHPACPVTTRPLQAADPAPRLDWTQTPGRAACCVRTRPLCASGSQASPDWTQTPGRAACCVTTRPLRAPGPGASPDWTQTPGRAACSVTTRPLRPPGTPRGRPPTGDRPRQCVARPASTGR